MLLAVLVTPDAYATLAGRSCGDWAARNAKGAGISMRDVADAAADTQERFAPALPFGYDAVATPGWVLYATDPNAELWVHEMAHQAQMRRDGALRYGWRYAREWLAGRFSGCGTLDAKRNIGYEREAELLGRQLNRHLEALWVDGDFRYLLEHMRHDDRPRMGTVAEALRATLIDMGVWSRDTDRDLWSAPAP